MPATNTNSAAPPAEYTNYPVANNVQDTLYLPAWEGGENHDAIGFREDACYTVENPRKRKSEEEQKSEAARKRVELDELERTLLAEIDREERLENQQYQEGLKHHQSKHGAGVYWDGLPSVHKQMAAQQTQPRPPKKAKTSNKKSKKATLNNQDEGNDASFEKNAHFYNNGNTAVGQTDIQAPANGASSAHNVDFYNSSVTVAQNQAPAVQSSGFQLHAPMLHGNTNDSASTAQTNGFTGYNPSVVYNDIFDFDFGPPQGASAFNFNNMPFENTLPTTAQANIPVIQIDPPVVETNAHVARNNAPVFQDNPVAAQNNGHINNHSPPLSTRPPPQGPNSLPQDALQRIASMAKAKRGQQMGASTPQEASTPLKATMPPPTSPRAPKQPARGVVLPTKQVPQTAQPQQQESGLVLPRMETHQAPLAQQPSPGSVLPPQQMGGVPRAQQPQKQMNAKPRAQKQQQQASRSHLTIKQANAMAKYYQPPTGQVPQPRQMSAVPRAQRQQQQPSGFVAPPKQMGAVTPTPQQQQLPSGVVLTPQQAYAFNQFQQALNAHAISTNPGAAHPQNFMPTRATQAQKPPVPHVNVNVNPVVPIPQTRSPTTMLGYNTIQQANITHRAQQQKKKLEQAPNGNKRPPRLLCGAFANQGLIPQHILKIADHIRNLPRNSQGLIVRNSLKTGDQAIHCCINKANGCLRTGSNEFADFFGDLRLLVYRDWQYLKGWTPEMKTYDWDLKPRSPTVTETVFPFIDLTNEEENPTTYNDLPAAGSSINAQFPADLTAFFPQQNGDFHNACLSNFDMCSLAQVPTEPNASDAASHNIFSSNVGAVPQYQTQQPQTNDFSLNMPGEFYLGVGPGQGTPAEQPQTNDVSRNMTNEFYTNAGFPENHAEQWKASEASPNMAGGFSSEHPTEQPNADEASQNMTGEENSTESEANKASQGMHVDVSSDVELFGEDLSKSEADDAQNMTGSHSSDFSGLPEMQTEQPKIDAAYQSMAGPQNQTEQMTNEAIQKMTSESFFSGNGIPYASATPAMDYSTFEEGSGTLDFDRFSNPASFVGTNSGTVCQVDFDFDFA